GLAPEAGTAVPSAPARKTAVDASETATRRTRATDQVDIERLELRDWTAILRAVGGAVERLGAPWNRPFGWGAGTPIWPVRLFAIPRSRDRPLTSTRSSVIDPSLVGRFGRPLKAEPTVSDRRPRPSETQGLSTDARCVLFQRARPLRAGQLPHRARGPGLGLTADDTRIDLRCAPRFCHRLAHGAEGRAVVAT